MEQESLLTGLEFNPVLASTGKRFLNLLIDLVFVYIFAVCVGVFLIVGTGSDYNSHGDLYYRLAGYLIFLSYYFICEIAFKGRTVAKFITGTKTVNEDGTEPKSKTYLLRSLSRMVPFEPFSAFGSRPWHDRWTRTYVIDIKKTAVNDSFFQ